MNKYELSISLVIWNGAKWLEGLLESLRAQSYQDYFLIVIDNNSADNSVRVVENFLSANPDLESRSRLVRNKQNIGFARAHNQGMAWTNSPYVMLLNQDVILDENYLRESVTILRERLEAGAVGGKILRMPSVQSTAEASELPKEKIIDSVGLVINRSHAVIERGAGEIDHGQYDFEKPVFGISGTVPIYRREALEMVSNGHEVLDEDFVSYKEDVDLAWRLQLGGWGAWYTPTAVAWHVRSLSSMGNLHLQIKKRRSWSKELKIYSLVNHWAVWLKNDSFVSLLKDFPWVFTAEAKRIGYYLVFEPLTLVRAKLRWCKLIMKFYRKRKFLKSIHRLKPQDLRRWWR